MNNNMLAAAVVWAAEEELKADGRKYKKALLKYSQAAIDTIRCIDNKEFGATLRRLDIDVDEAVEELDGLTNVIERYEPYQLMP